MRLAKSIYVVTSKLPKEEVYGLSSQLRRAAVSIPSNIAEGYGRDSKGNFVRFLRMSQGSLKELETQLLLCVDLGFAINSDIDPLLEQSDRIGKMLRGLIKSQSRSIP